MGLNLNPIILNAYGFDPENLIITQIGSGLINRTYLLSGTDGIKYILQNINTHVFKSPDAIATNIKKISSYLNERYPGYLFITPISTTQGLQMFNFENEYWRLLPYVDSTISLDVISLPVQAYEAAKQFGKLSRLLNSFNPQQLQQTIPGFHDLNLRYLQFQEALNSCSDDRRAQSLNEIETTQQHKYLLNYYNSFLKGADFPDRVMHHDTKISNVLLEKDTFKGVCVIDLDTIMPGKFISDLGDMMRTYLCAYSENEIDLTKIIIRIPYFTALINGYLEEMAIVLTNTEKELILFSGKYIIYMQAIRFLTDFLDEDIYYPINYSDQNLDRAKNQFKLLHELFANEQELQFIIDENLNKYVRTQ